jgi:hypothetical protein
MLIIASYVKHTAARTVAEFRKSQCIVRKAMYKACPSESGTDKFMQMFI